VLLDRDGTVNRERHYLSNPDDLELCPGAAAGLRRLQALGLGVVILTNQSAIGRGYFDPQRLALIHGRLQEMLAAEGIVVDGFYYCPHVPADACACRKPRPGMAVQAAKEHGFSLADSFVIGDKLCDVELAGAIGATSFLVLTGYGKREVSKPACRPDFVVEDLVAAAAIIEQRIRQ
jgi:D-glycero-D-manno-heptose 1,7-bisphosphate phosphatase